MSELITPATYSGVHVLQIADSYGQPVMRRAHDDYINATQVLRAAGFPKTQRTKILERDISGGVHEKVQGGFHMFQGTWVPLDTAIKLARKHGVVDVLMPLFEFTLPNAQHSDIFKSIGKFAKPYRIPRAKVDPRPASSRIASTAQSSHFDSDLSDVDDGEPDDEDDEENEDSEDNGKAKEQRTSPQLQPLANSTSSSSAESSTNESSPPLLDNTKKPGPSASPNSVAASLAATGPNSDRSPAPTPNPLDNPPSLLPKSNTTSPTGLLPTISFTPQSNTQPVSAPPTASTSPQPYPQQTPDTPPVKRGPGRPKGSKNNPNRGSASPAPTPRRSDSSSSLNKLADSASPEREVRTSGRVIPPPTTTSTSSNANKPPGTGRGRGRPRGAAAAAIAAAAAAAAAAKAALDEKGHKKQQDGDDDGGPVVLGPDELRERDIMELMDPYGVLNRRDGWSSDDEDVEDDGDGAGDGGASTAEEGDEDEEEEDDDRWLSGPGRQPMRGRKRRAGSRGFDSVDAMSEVSSVDEDEATTLERSNGLKRKSAKTRRIGGFLSKRLSPCSSCGVLTPSRWKRNGFNATVGILCDGCGLKWCFGKGSAAADASTSMIGIEDGNEEDQARVQQPQEQEEWKPMNDDGVAPQAGEVSEFQTLRNKLEESEKNGKRLRKLLEALKREDAGVDRAFRRTIIWCRRVKQQQNTMQLLDDKENAGASTDDDEDYIEGDDDFQWSQEAVNGFIGAVCNRS
ncbi:hypothetical protein HDU79_005381 [Rhizoclosmatium sp. JEL0117]|nr:hypothetical protein HDU79_005381 [Rhizoclosmatium sp. JEL0117]